MEMIIKKWGNSLAARIPKTIADSLSLKLDQKINIETRRGKIIITPIIKDTEYKIEELLDQCPSELMILDDDDKAWLNSDPVGKEW